MDATIVKITTAQQETMRDQIAEYLKQKEEELCSFADQLQMKLQAEDFRAQANHLLKQQIATLSENAYFVLQQHQVNRGVLSDFRQQMKEVMTEKDLYARKAMDLLHQNKMLKLAMLEQDKRVNQLERLVEASKKELIKHKASSLQAAAKS